MKKLMFIIMAIFVMTACEKMENPFEKHKKSKPCPTVNSESVPSTVMESFNHKYPGTSVEKWFDMGDKGYSAVFTKNNIKNLAEFDKDGNFVNEESGDNNDGDNNDEENNDDNDCSCDISEDED